MSGLAPPLAAEGLTQRMRHRTILRGCTFAVPSGTTALLGPNGAGKTVLLRTLAGITPAAAGRVWLGGGEAVGPADLLREVAYVPQFPGVHPRLTVRDHLERTARWRRIAGPRGCAEEAAERLGLSRWMHVAAGRLGPAQRHRLALAEAWVCRARIVLFDEPTADLDPEERAAFWSQAAALPSEAVVVTTHHFDEVQAHCRAALVLQGGRMRFAGTVADLAAAADGCCFLLPPGAPGLAGCIVVGITPAGMEVLAREPLDAPERPAGPLDGYVHVLGAAAAAGLGAAWSGAAAEVAVTGQEMAESEAAAAEGRLDQWTAAPTGSGPDAPAAADGHAPRLMPAAVTEDRPARDRTPPTATAATAATAPAAAPPGSRRGRAGRPQPPAAGGRAAGSGGSRRATEAAADPEPGPKPEPVRARTRTQAQEPATAPEPAQAARAPDRRRTPEPARAPDRGRTPEPARAPDRGRTPEPAQAAEPKPATKPEPTPAAGPAPQPRPAADSRTPAGREPAPPPDAAPRSEPGPQADAAPALSLPPLGPRRGRRRGPRP